MFPKARASSAVYTERSSNEFPAHTGQLFLGGKLAAGANVSLNPLLSAGWAGLLANALNCIPVGERMPSGFVASAVWRLH